MNWRRYFPYDPRPGQEEIINRILNAHKNIILEAPAGYGKSIAVLAALLPKGKILWVVRTGNETNRPIEELKKIRKRIGTHVMAISYRGRADMCLVAEERKWNLSWKEISIICRAFKCRYRDMERIRKIAGSLDGSFTFDEIREIAKANGICPYYLQRELAQRSQLVALSYNYVFDMRVGRDLIALGEYLVVDEAHNLIDVMINLNSRTLSRRTVERAIKEARGRGVQRYLYELLDWFDTNNKGVARRLNNIPLDEEMVEIMVQMGENIVRKSIEEGREIRSALLSVASFIEAAMERRDHVLIFYPGRHPSAEVFNMGAADLLSEIWDRYKQVVLMSGTFGPVNAFAETIGLRDYIHVRAQYPINPSNVLPVILTDLTTRGAVLSREMARKYVDAIVRFERGMFPRNTAIFASSYRIMEELLNAGLEDRLFTIGKNMITEKPDMGGDMVKEYMKLMSRNRRITLLAVAGGRFSEGADFPGSALEGVFLVGVPYVVRTPRVDALIEHYSRLYGRNKGWEYAYGLPAIRKAVQALGRPLRSASDIGVLVCGDYRYRRKVYLLPGYFKFAKYIPSGALERLIRSFFLLHG